MTTINDDARMSELYKMRSEGVELQWYDKNNDQWHSDLGELSNLHEYRAKPTPVYVWADIEGGIVVDVSSEAPIIPENEPNWKRYQLIEAPEEE